MAVGSIGSLGASLSSFYQSVSGGTQSSTLATVFSAPPAAPIIETQTDEAVTPRARQTADQGFSQIEAAVYGALSAAQSNPTADPGAIIEEAIAQSFAVPASTDQSKANPQGNPTDSSATNSYLESLHSFGVDPQKFHDDLQSAVKDAQHGKVDSTAVFRNFPVGSSLDAVA